MPDFLFPKEGITNRSIPCAPAPLKVPLYVAKLWSESPTALAQEHPQKKHHEYGVCFVSGSKSPTRFSLCRAGLLLGLSLGFRSRMPAQQKNTPRLRGCFYFWWPWSDSNRHSLQNLILSQARLPIPPRGQNHAAIKRLLPCFQPF